MKLHHVAGVFEPDGLEPDAGTCECLAKRAKMAL